MNNTTCSKMDKIFDERDRILSKLKSKPVVLHIKENSWRDAIPRSYRNMKELQSRIITIV